MFSLDYPVREAIDLIQFTTGKSIFLRGKHRLRTILMKFSMLALSSKNEHTMVEAMVCDFASDLRQDTQDRAKKQLHPF